MPYAIDFGDGRKVEISGQEILDLLWINYEEQFTVQNQDSLKG